MKVVIIGGVAAGATAAARLRRLDESAEIILLERGHDISYANCGLPYHLGNVIPERDSLLVFSAEAFRRRFHVDVRTDSEVVKIDPAGKTVSVRESSGRVYSESWDKLLIATGSTPKKTEIPGSGNPRVHPLWTLADMDKLMKFAEPGADAVIVGAGFVGLETAENLAERGMKVTIFQRSGRVMPTLDEEMGTPLRAELANLGITLKTGELPERFEEAGNRVRVVSGSGTIDAALVVSAIGVVPNSDLARAAGIELGPRGHIRTDPGMRTNLPDVYAAGDTVETWDSVSRSYIAVPLAGPANKQGRTAADNMAGIESEYHAASGSSVMKLGGLTAASTGKTERALKDSGAAYEKIYLHPGSNASYYPGSAKLHLKLMFSKTDGEILGAQAVGAKGADKRIDVIATAMRLHLKAWDLATLELAYAPPYNSAKDPVNYAGFIAENIKNNLTEPWQSDALPPDALLLDVREPAEYELGTIPGSVNLPLGTLRESLGGLDRTKRIAVFCQVGLRGYLAERILRQNGFDAHNLSGGYTTWKLFHPAKPAVRCSPAPAPASAPASAPLPSAAVEKAVQLDVRALACPGPVVRLKKEIGTLPENGLLRMLAPLSFESDLNAWSAATGNRIESLAKKDGFLEALIRRGSDSSSSTPASGDGWRKSDSAAIVLFSNDLDKAMAAFILACGFASAGARVDIFFTFWGLSVLRKNPAPAVKKNLVSRMFGWMLPKGAKKLALSKMNMAGLGSSMMKKVMAEQNVTSLPELIVQARMLGVHFLACEMAMNVMGLSREELVEVDDVVGVASFAALAKNAGTTLFI